MYHKEKYERILSESSLDEIMRKAFEVHILVPAFNVAYLPMVKPIVEVLMELKCFGLLEVALPDIEKFGAQSFSAVKQEYEKYENKAYTRLHLDHVPVIDEDGDFVDWNNLIQKVLDLGYDSVMIDGSRLGLEENIDVTKKVVKLAHAHRVPVEAELGAIYGHEKGPLPPYEELFRSSKGFTDVEEAKRFVKETGVDWLSVAIGNVHGAISGAAKDEKKVNARLNIEHLAKIVSVTNVPIVLHGGSGIERESVLAGIKNGVTKINIGTAIRQAYEKELRKTGRIESSQNMVKEEIRQLIVDYYGIRGSAEKLAALLQE
ncbi:class II fructose-bisphosphate aldolase [Candidatus Bathyarchaeota archaeon]|nr:class II fructose-bisphosphate aldolase [Candidatus Bathyarchaeota archaeon]